LILSFQAESNIINAEPFKKSALAFCVKEPTPLMRKNCVLVASANFSDVKVFSNSDSGQRAIRLCLRTVDMTLDTGVYELVSCSSRHYQLTAVHPESKWLDWVFKLDELRPKWIQQCVSSFGNDVSKCMSLKESGFYMFWGEYSKAKTKKDVSLIAECVNPNFKSTNFERYPACIKY
jgi:hypothetical protein